MSILFSTSQPDRDCQATQAWLSNQMSETRASLSGNNRSPRSHLSSVLVSDFISTLVKDGFKQSCAAFRRIQSSAQKSDYVIAAMDHLEDACESGALTTYEAFDAFSKLVRLLQNDATDRFPSSPVSSNAARLLLAAPEGEQHVFGAEIMADHLKREGLQVELLLQAPGMTIAERLATQHYDVLGLSIGSDANLAGLADFIGDVRRDSCNRDMRVMVGGQAFDRSAGEYDFLGADLVNTKQMSYIASCRTLGLTPATAGSVGYS